MRALLFRALGDEVDTAAGQLLGVDAFIRALDDPDLEIRVRDRDPENLDAAVRIARLCESHSDLARRGGGGDKPQSNHARGAAHVNAMTEPGPVTAAQSETLTKTKRKKSKKVGRGQVTTAAINMSPNHSASTHELLLQRIAQLEQQAGAASQFQGGAVGVGRVGRTGSRSAKKTGRGRGRAVGSPFNA
jgi:hypothetical protein